MRLVVDIETNGFLDVLDKIHCIVAVDLDTNEEHSFVPHTIGEGIALLSEADELIAHNGITFDVPAIQKLYPSFKPKKVVDTLVCSRLIWSNLSELDWTHTPDGLPTKRYGSHALEAWGYRMGELKGVHGKQENAWEVYTPEMLEYCKQDVNITVLLYKKILAAKYSPRALTIEHKMADLMWTQEQNGFVFNEKKAQALYVDLATQRAEIFEELYDLFPAWVERVSVQAPKRTVRYKDPLKADRHAGAEFTVIKVVSFNPASRTHIANRLKSKYGWKPKALTPNGAAKIDETVLAKLEYPEAQHIAKYFMLQKRLGQLSDGANGWLKCVKNGKIHGRVNPNGAITGRGTHSNPNIAQVPSLGTAYGKECRELFTVPTGWKLMGADASGLELRCLGHYMHRFDGGDYIDVVLNGDIHTVNQIAAGLPTRDASKRFIYSYLYGGGDELIGSLIGGGAKEGKKIKKSFLDKTPALAQLREAVLKAAKVGYIVAVDGRRIAIRSPHAALNSLLQSAGGLICKQWLIFFEEEMQAQGFTSGWAGDYANCAWVHDEMQVAVREEHAEQVGKIAVQTIQRVTEFFNFKCPLDGEYKIGSSWAETH
jgi:DNA polymerase I-like protein with 3'-5' exonuclease and polymerase domains